MAKNNAQTINRTKDAYPANYSSSIRHDEKRFDLVIDGMPYRIKSIPFLFNDALRFRIIVNETSEHVFAWDSEASILRAIDDDAAVVPAGVEEALSEKLRTELKL